ncbi:hypothetical protein [Streptomyces mirabilis]|uniref:hypothetical protein n=1 Tax=Streptomyces mirabilis TaxID=68239 RepID=UPI0036A7C42A
MSHKADTQRGEPGISADRPGHPPGAELVPQGERDKLTLRAARAARTGRGVVNKAAARDDGDLVSGDSAAQPEDTSHAAGPLSS